MAKKKEEKGISSHHQQTIIRTYLTLTFAFICMICINIFAYFTIIKMSEMYSKLKNSAINIKLITTNANLQFREIMSGYSKEDMNKVWNMMAKALTYTEPMVAIDEKDILDERIKCFKDVMLRCYTIDSEEAAPDEGEEENKIKRGPGAAKSKFELQQEAAKRAALKEEYENSFKDLILQVDHVESRLTELITGKMKTFKTLYIALIVNILLLFAFIVFTFSRYITTSRKIERELRWVKENLDTVLNSLDSIVFTIDAKGIVTQFNSESEKYFNISASRILNQYFWDVITDLEAYKTNVDKVFHSQKPEKLIREVVNVRGTERYLNISLSPLIHGKKGVVIQIDDVTSMEKMDEQIRQSQKMEVVENLVGGLAHDFNNVLGAVTGTISMIKYSLENQDASIEDVRDNIDVIESSTERATVMVQQLLTLSTKHEIKLTPVDLNASVKHVIKICKNTFDKRIQLTLEIYDSPVMVKADEAQLEQMLLNLCDNAAQAMTSLREEGETKGGELTISLDRIFPDKIFRQKHPQAVKSAYWILGVSDTGIGMDNETLAKIYDPFFTTKKKGEGSGLGMTMVNDIVQKHEGFIDINSNPGSGTTIYIYLPELVVDGAQTGVVTPTADKETIPTGSGLVLVVDDEPIMRKTAKSILVKLGYDVIFAQDGEIAVEVFRERHDEIVLILLDMAMPKKSGKEAYIEMKEIDPNLKVLLVSGFKKDKRIEEVLALGVNGFMQKPYSIVELSQEIDRIIRTSEGKLAKPSVSITTTGEEQKVEIPQVGDDDMEEVGFETVIIKTRRSAKKE